MKHFKLLSIILGLSALTGCSKVTVGAGEEVTFIKQPYFFGDQGVDKKALSTGLHWHWMSTNTIVSNIKPIKLKEHFNDLTASDNVAIDFDVYLTLKLIEGQTPLLYEESGENWYSNKIEDQFRSYVRNEARTRSSIALRTDEKTILEVQETIYNLMVKYIASIKLPVKVIKVNIGKVVPPTEVLLEAAQTAAQKQKKKTQDQRKLAEDARKFAEESAAKADKAYANEFNMTTDQFLYNKKLDIMSKAADNGHTTLILNASEAKPMINVNK
ncbi:MAG: hypothetical protein HAW67_03550 [Endozoicomonadaceae bacterium]|nr:hypothetical protein [Endozoicomonadaceae bacterium]